MCCDRFSDKPVVNCVSIKCWKHDLAVITRQYERVKLLLIHTPFTMADVQSLQEKLYSISVQVPRTHSVTGLRRKSSQSHTVTSIYHSYYI